MLRIGREPCWQRGVSSMYTGLFKGRGVENETQKLRIPRILIAIVFVRFQFPK